MTKQPRPEPLKTTVTYLEMTAPPQVHFPLPMNVQAAVMRARNIPLHFYRYLQYRTGRPWHWVYRLRLDDDALARIVHSDRTIISVLYLDGAPAGFFELCREDESTVDLVLFRADGACARPRAREMVPDPGRDDRMGHEALPADGEHQHARPPRRTAALSADRIPAHRTDGHLHPASVDEDLLRLARLD